MTDSLEIKIALRNWMEVVMARSMHDWMHYVKASGISMPQLQVLMRLFYRGGCGVSHVSEDMSITNAAASQLVDKIFQQGLLDRVEDPTDRRAKQLTITEKGREFVAAGIEQRYVWIDELSEQFSDEERETIMQALAILSEKATIIQKPPQRTKVS
jgi:DNA-binding MarR family transcriptional regulator